MGKNIVEKAVQIIFEKRPDCVLALTDLDGYPKATAKTVVKNDGINTLFFTTSGHNKKLVENCNRAGICFFSLEQGYNITLIGKIEVITDPKIRKKMWTKECEEFWNGPEDENYCVLKFTTERYKIFFGEEEIEGKI